MPRPMKKSATAARRNGTVRCAIYTRKSSEEGLEQEFNSLQAQREACEAFIESQRQEGWLCLRAAYDDGGFSGATMDRPALQQLLGERIRDKIAASKKKGMWMGGVPPLGYRAQDGKLIIVESEAETVRFIFRRYAELGSVRLLKEELDASGIQSKLRTSTSGRLRGGKPFARGALYLMLQNRIYRGEIVHKEQSHPGEHTPIIDQPLWDAVQAQLASNAAERNSS